MDLPDGSVRKRRVSVDTPGHAHELNFSCHRRLRLLVRDRTRLWFIEALDRARSKLGFELWSYVIMPDHAHVVVFPRDPACTVDRMLQSIKQPVAMRAISWLRANAPEQLGRLRYQPPAESAAAVHRFWQPGGGYDRNLWSGDAIWNTIDYIHRNPVRAGLVKDPLDWEWSSARWYAGQTDVPLAMDRAPPVWRKTKTFG